MGKPAQSTVKASIPTAAAARVYWEILSRTEGKPGQVFNHNDQYLFGEYLMSLPLV